MAEQPLAPPAAATRRILVIEPSASLREMLAFALRSHGHGVICVPDADAGLHHLTMPGTEIPDLIILALQPDSWPQRDLLNLLAFGRLYHHVAIILLTTPEHRPQLPPYLAVRPIARLDKPFTVQQLWHLVATLPVVATLERSAHHG